MVKVVAPVLLGISATCSASLNAIVLYVFAKIGLKKLTFKDAFMLSMTVGDLMQSLLGYSLEIYFIAIRQIGKNNNDRELMFCKASGFIVTFLALASISHLTALAYDRYLTICKPFLATRIHNSFFLASVAISLCWFYALLWGSFPLCGWSSYNLESDKLRCSIHWASRSTKDQAYIVFLFIFCFIIPVSVMSFSFLRVRKELHLMQGRAANLFGRESKAAKDNIRAERRHTQLAITMCTVFILTWTPYSLLSFWSSFFAHIAETPVALATTAALIAKSSTIFTPIIYSVVHKKFRQSLSSTRFGKLLCLKTKVAPGETSTPEFTQQQ